MNKFLWVLVLVFGLNTFLLQSQTTNISILTTKISSDGLKITMVFNKAIYGTNKGFTIHNTASKVFSSITGFGTKNLVGTLANPVVYGEAINISYKSIETLDNILGDLVDSNGVNVGYFLKELVDTSALIFTGTEKYVTATASGGGDGSIANPYTFEEMIANLETFISSSKTGVRFNLKAGLYSNKGSVTSNIEGEIGKPIIIEGYTKTEGDKPNVGWDYFANKKMNSSIMPLFDGGNKVKSFFTTSWSSYITIKNIQIRDYKNSCIYTNVSHNIYIDNIVVEKADRLINIVGGGLKAYDNVITNCNALNGYRANFQFNGNNYLIQNNKSYGDTSVGDATDYYYSLFSNYNVMRNNYGNRVGNVSHSGHGLSINTSSPGITNNSDTNSTQYNFIVGHTSINMGKQIEFRHGGVKYNVVRDFIAHGGVSGAKESGGIMFRDNASYNIVENAYINDVNTAIYFTESVEIGVGLGHDNIIRNSVFTNLKFGIRGENYNKGLGDGSKNKIYNCTFYNVNVLFRLSQSDAKFSNNKLVNNIFYNVPTLSYDAISGWSYENNNFYKSFEKPVGVNNISEDPLFKNAAGGDFRLMPDSPLKNKGQDLEQVKIDFDRIPRPQGGSTDIGAFEIIDNTTGSIKADAGKDQTICLGETTTLTARGGSTYLWNTGDTTASITVSPTTTKTYSVTVSEGSDSDLDEVLITVNNVTANAGSDLTINVGDSTTLSASGGDTYLWSTGETTASINVSPTTTETYKVTVTKNNCEDTDNIKVTVNASSAPPTVIANAGEDQTVCLGDKVTLTASGGSGYIWSNGATTSSITVNPIITTKYTVTVKDKGESDTDDIIITVNSVTAKTGSDVTINLGETTTLTASGGDTYLWSTGETTNSITVSPTATTTYKVTVIKNNCEDTDNVKVTVIAISPPPSLTVIANAGEDQTICLGDNVTLTASGGSSYIWSNGATTASISVSPIATKKYSVTVKDNDTTDTDEVLVTVNSVTANAGSNTTINEGEKSATLTASGGDSYLWSTGETSKEIIVNPMNTKIYTVTVYQNNCEDSDSVQVTVNKKPVPAVANAGNNISICLGEKAKLKASGGSTYLWSTGDTNRNITVSPTRTTTYTLIATRGGITNSDTVVVTVENCKDNSEADNLNAGIDVYPNPTSGILNVNVRNNISNDLNLVLISLNGSIVFSDKISSNAGSISKQIDLSRFAKGIYFVRLFNANQNKVKKILVI